MKNYNKGFVVQRIISGLIALSVIVICAYFFSQRGKPVEDLDGVIDKEGYLNKKNSTPENIKFVKIAGQNIKVDLALTNSEIVRGLSERSSLEDNEGMLFVFPKPGKHVFWMKDMNFPIDIIWLDENMKIIYIKKDASPKLYPETYSPNENAKYVLEVVSGFSDKNNLKVGDVVNFTY